MLDLNWIGTLKTPIAIIGLGKSGNSALSFLQEAGVKNSDLLTFDSKDPKADISDPNILINKKPGTLVVSPGVSLKQGWIEQLILGGAVVTSEISLAAKLLTNEVVVGVTGSVGKSTVVSILGAGVKSEDENSFVGGNIGTPFCEYARNLLQGGQKAKFVILELSSYQLENCKSLSLDYAAITFLSANHLERYENLDDYYLTKLKITEITKKMCVFNKSSPDCVAWVAKAKCETYLTNAQLELSSTDRKSILLFGEHNHDNFAIAKKIATQLGWTEKAMQKMYGFKGLPHRLQNAGTHNGAIYINDSKATAMDSVLVATSGCLEKISERNHLYLLLGGKDKNLPWRHLSVLAFDPRLKFVFFGECRQVAQQNSGLKGEAFARLQQALDFCLSSAQTNDLVLLSPGGTSLDEFKNFEERGKFFADYVARKD